MGNLRSFVSVALVSLAACGDDGGSGPADARVVVVDAAPDAFVPDAPPDAPNYDLSCYQNAAPTTATATVTLSGTASEVIVNGITPTIQEAADVTIDACTGNCTGPDLLDTTTTDANGAWTTDAIATTNNEPLDGYLKAVKTGNRTTYIYPASPIVADQPGVPVFMLTPGAVVGIGLIGPDQTPGNSIVGILVTDCSNPPVGITGATVAVKQGGTAVGDPPFDLSTFDPMGAGAFLITNVPPNAATEVSATYNGMTFRAHVVQAVADTTTMTQVKPGY